MNSNGHNFSNEMGAILTGAVTAASIGTFVFQMLGTFLLGIIGACGGWVFIQFVQPWLQKKFVKKTTKKA